MEVLLAKYQRLLDLLASFKSVAVAFSGGVDSTFLLFAAKQALQDGTPTRVTDGAVTDDAVTDGVVAADVVADGVVAADAVTASVVTAGVVAVTAVSASFPASEMREASRYCRELGIYQKQVSTKELEIEGFKENPPNRCYLCKREIFGNLLATAQELGAAILVEGSNVDDLGDYRPGMVAIRELGVRSPLQEVGLTKAEIRKLSAYLEIPTWNKPSYACLATRIPYGEEITEHKLHMIEQAEEYLRGLGYAQMRVRHHGNLARIEIPPTELERFMEEECRTQVDKALKNIGYTYVTLDVMGYRTGSMNETLTEAQKSKALKTDMQ